VCGGNARGGCDASRQRQRALCGRSVLQYGSAPHQVCGESRVAASQGGDHPGCALSPVLSPHERLQARPRLWRTRDIANVGCSATFKCREVVGSVSLRVVLARFAGFPKDGPSRLGGGGGGARRGLLEGRYTTLTGVTVLYFRDGVSEGQFEHVRLVEVPFLHAAIRDDVGAARTRSLPSQSPHAWWLRKRHHTRLFA
jgi:hypothetical protein